MRLRLECWKATLSNTSAALLWLQRGLLCWRYCGQGYMLVDLTFRSSIRGC